jgi:dihydroorotate dehydrogenase
LSFALLRAALFRLPPETAHNLSLAGLDRLHELGLLRHLVPAPPPTGPHTCLGLEFPNPIGLAAGLDKNADHVDALGALGFGFIEVGTVTPRPQPGNPRPRLFRIPAHRALINRMGFNNKGVDHAVQRLQRRRFAGIVGVNIGKNRDTDLGQAIDDYLFCLHRVHPVADYVTVNISSPNTPGLRDLQSGAALDGLLGPLVDEARRLDANANRRVPLLVKIAPDLDAAALDGLAAAALRHGIDGIIATNTTADHASVAGSRHADETGGLSGAPLATQSTEVLRGLAQRLEGHLPLIGVGGIDTGAAAAAKQAAGACLVQVYTGFIYRGPALIAEAARACHDA